MLGPVQVLVVAVTDDDAAASVLSSAGELAADAPVRCLDAFAVEVGDDGEVTVEPGDHPSLALFAAEGTDPGPTSDEATWSLVDAISPGGRAVVVLLEHRWATGLVGDLRAAGATLAHEAWLREDDRAELEALLRDRDRLTGSSPSTGVGSGESARTLRTMVQVEHRRTARGAGVGVLVGLWAFADGLIIGLPVLIATVATGRGLFAYTIGAATYVLVNLGACRWLDDQWDTWVVGSSFERRLLALRARPRAARAVSAIQRGTTRGYGIAAVLLDATQVVALHRVLVGVPTEPHHRTVASVVPALLYPALYAVLGLLIHSVV